MRNITLSSTQCQSLTKMTRQHCVWQDALVSVSSMFRALWTGLLLSKLRKMLCSTLHYAQAASLWMHPFLCLEILLQFISEKVTSMSLNPAILHSTTCSLGSQKAACCPEAVIPTRSIPYLATLCKVDQEDGPHYSGPSNTLYVVYPEGPIYGQISQR